MRDGDHEQIDLFLLDQTQQIVAVAQDWEVGKAELGLGGIVVNKVNYFIVRGSILAPVLSICR